VVAAILREIAELLHDLLAAVRQPPLLPLVCLFVVVWIIRTAIGVS
jgi:hypothetical protein